MKATEKQAKEIDAIEYYESKHGYYDLDKRSSVFKFAKDFANQQSKSDKEKYNKDIKRCQDEIELQHSWQVQYRKQVTQLQAKAKRDFDTFNQNESTYLDRIIQVEKNSVSTEYLEETVFNYKKQIIKLKQETQKLKEVLSNINKPKCEKCNCIITDNQSIESGLCDSCLLKD